MATLNVGKARFYLGYNKVLDGDYEGQLFSRDHGSWNTSVNKWQVYPYEDESSYYVRAGYDFSNYIPGLVADVMIITGHGAKDIDDFSQQETASYVSYNFSGRLDGLRLAWYYVEYRGQGKNAGPRGWRLYDETTNRFYLTYTFNVFGPKKK